MTNTSDIANTVDIKTPSLYSHFKGKDEILLVTIEKEITRYHTFLDTIYLNMTFTNLKEDLYALFKKILGYFSDTDLIRFWRNLLLIDQNELRRTCSQQVFELEIYHVEKLKRYLKHAVMVTQTSWKEEHSIFWPSYKPRLRSSYFSMNQNPQLTPT